VNPGETLVEVGDTERLDVRIDVLSQEAVRIEPGTPVLLDLWGGDVPLEAIVERVEPDAFTDVSSLGVEERRVTVVANLVSPPKAWSNLGAGYRVLARFIVWEETNVLQIPTGAVFQTDEGQAVFVVENGRAIRRPVTLGQQAGLTVQILSGVTEGDVVIVHIDSEIEDGMRVEAR
jgi:HlyD family secretion protein